MGTRIQSVGRGIRSWAALGVASIVVFMAVTFTANALARGDGAGQTCGASASSFCVSSASGVPALFPGGRPSPLPITFTNPTDTRLEVSSLTVTFANAFPAGCDASAFRVDGRGASGPQPSVTITFPQPVIVPARTGSGPGITTHQATLSMADNGRNQDACAGLHLALQYAARAS
jgi:hypothetical protein